MATYREILETLDAKNFYTEWDTRPVKKLNCVVRIHAETTRRTFNKTVFAPTVEKAEKETRIFYENVLKSVDTRNKWVDAENAKEEKYAKESGYMPFLLDHEKINLVEIDATDRDNNKWTITL